MVSKDSRLSVPNHAPVYTCLEPRVFKLPSSLSLSFLSISARRQMKPRRRTVDDLIAGFVLGCIGCALFMLVALSPRVVSIGGVEATDLCPFANCTTNPTNTTCCSGTCVNLQNDPQHCGSCNTACASGSNCLLAQCLPLGAMCNTAQYLAYCSNVEPCIFYCPPAPATCTYLNTTCFNTVFTNVRSTVAQTRATCGPFYANVNPLIGTCTGFTNGGGYTGCTFDPNDCICATEAPPEFQEPGSPPCEYDYINLPCLPSEVGRFCGMYGTGCTKECLYPPPTNILAIGYPGRPYDNAIVQAMSAYCAAHVCANCFFDVGIQNCTTGASDVSLRCPCSLVNGNPGSLTVCFPVPYPAQFIPFSVVNRRCSEGTEQLTGFYSGGVFEQGPGLGSPCSPSSSQCNFINSTDLPGVYGYFNVHTCGCQANDTIAMTQFVVDYFNAQCNATAGQIFDFEGGAGACKIPTGGGPCTQADVCQCKPGYGFPSHTQYCGYKYEADVCLAHPAGAPDLREISTCGVFYDQAYWLCALNNTAFSTGPPQFCRPVCVCKPGTGSLPGVSTSAPCDSEEAYCNNDDVVDFCGFGYVNCTKRCQYSLQNNGRVYQMGLCSVVPQSCVLGDVVFEIPCNASQFASCGPATASCIQSYRGNKLQGNPQCTCTDTGFQSAFWPCDEWEYYIPQTPVNCITDCKPGWMTNVTELHQIPGSGAITGCWRRRFMFDRMPISVEDAFWLITVNQLEDFNDALLTWNSNMANVRLYASRFTIMYEYYLTRCDCDASMLNGAVGSARSPFVVADTGNVIDKAYFVNGNLIQPAPLVNVSSTFQQDQILTGACTIEPTAVSPLFGTGTLRLSCSWIGQLRGNPLTTSSSGTNHYAFTMDIAFDSGGQAWAFCPQNPAGPCVFTCGGGASLSGGGVQFAEAFEYTGIGAKQSYKLPSEVLTPITGSVVGCSSGQITIPITIAQTQLINSAPLVKYTGTFIGAFGSVVSESQLAFEGSIRLKGFYVASKQGTMEEVSWSTDVLGRPSFVTYNGFIGTKGKFYTVRDCRGPIQQGAPIYPPNPTTANQQTSDLPYYVTTAVAFNSHAGAGYCNRLGMPSDDVLLLWSYPRGLPAGNRNILSALANDANQRMPLNLLGYSIEMVNTAYLSDRETLLGQVNSEFGPCLDQNFFQSIVLNEQIGWYLDMEVPETFSAANPSAFYMRTNMEITGFNQFTTNRCFQAQCGNAYCQEWTPWYLMNSPADVFQQCQCITGGLQSGGTQCSKNLCCWMFSDLNGGNACPESADTRKPACQVFLGFVKQFSFSVPTPPAFPASWPVPIIPACRLVNNAPANPSICPYHIPSDCEYGNTCDLSKWQAFTVVYCHQGTPYIWKGTLRCACRPGWYEDPSTYRCTMTTCWDLPINVTQYNGANPFTVLPGVGMVALTQNECSGHGRQTANGCVCNAGWMGRCCSEIRGCQVVSPRPGSNPNNLDDYIGLPDGEGGNCDPAAGPMLTAYCDTNNTNAPFWVCQATPEGYYSGPCCYAQTWKFYDTNLYNCSHGNIGQPTERVTSPARISRGALPFNRGYNDPACICEDPWVGRQCDVMSCPSTSAGVCNHKGTCINGQCQQLISSGYAACQVNGTITQYGGCTCQVDIQSNCVRNNQICNNQGSCEPGTEPPLTYACSCQNGYTGTFCEIAPCDPTVCNRANLAGTCYLPTNSCVCAAEVVTATPFQGKVWAGQFCQTDVTAQCGVFSNGGRELRTCNGQGTCLFNNTGGYSCSCANGYTNGPAGQCTIAPCIPACGVHSFCNTLNGVNRCDCYPNWNKDGSGQCTVNTCVSGAISPDLPNGRCTCINPNRTIETNCLSRQCPISGGVVCGAIPKNTGGCGATGYCGAGTGFESCNCQSPSNPNGRCNCCNNGTCICHWSSILDPDTQTCVPRCSPDNTVSPVGKVVPAGGGFSKVVFDRCDCQTGWNPADNCFTPRCFNGGTWDGTKCICPPDFGTSNCNDPPCGDSTHGTWNPTTGKCTCFFPWAGATCEFYQCINDGVPGRPATVAPDSSCICPPAYTGRICEIDRCAITGHGHAAPGGATCICDDFWTGTASCSLCQEPYVLSHNDTVCNCSSNTFGPRCIYRVCGPAGVFNETSQTCMCAGITALDPATGNCTQRCGPNGVPNAALQVCLCQPGYEPRMPLDANHSVICIPVCFNGGTYNDTTYGCNCPAGTVQPFCTLPTSSSSSSSSSSTGVSSSSSTGPPSSTGSSTGSAPLAPDTVSTVSWAMVSVAGAAALAAFITAVVAASQEAARQAALTSATAAAAAARAAAPQLVPALQVTPSTPLLSAPFG